MGTNQRSQIVMSDTEIADFVTTSRTGTLATVGAGGQPHLVAMWYGVVGGEIWLETKIKSQKAVNLRRDPRIVCAAEAGHSYDELRGVSIEGTTTLIEDQDDPEYWAAGVNIWERYQGPYTDEMKPFVEIMMNKRVVVRVEPTRVRSWDHRKLGMDHMEPGGTTAAYL